MEHFTRKDLIDRGFDANSGRTSDYLFILTKYGNILAKNIGDDTFEIHAAYNAQREHLDTNEINGDMIGMIDTLEKLTAFLDDPTKSKRDLQLT